MGKSAKALMITMLVLGLASPGWTQPPERVELCVYGLPDHLPQGAAVPDAWNSISREFRFADSHVHEYQHRCGIDAFRQGIGYLAYDRLHTILWHPSLDPIAATVNRNRPLTAAATRLTLVLDLGQEQEQAQLELAMTGSESVEVLLDQVFMAVLRGPGEGIFGTHTVDLGALTGGERHTVTLVYGHPDPGYSRRDHRVENGFYVGHAILTGVPVPPEPQEAPTCNGVPATLVGTAHDDVLIGTPNDDVIIAGSGNDFIDGKGGKDLICAGPGIDFVVGGAGDDELFGGEDNDELRGGPGVDILHGNTGHDTLSGGEDADTLYGDAGADWLNGNSGSDVLNGGSDDDVLEGTSGDDALNGGSGMDDCSGGSGIDSASSCEMVSNVP